MGGVRSMPTVKDSPAIPPRVTRGSRSLSPRLLAGLSDPSAGKSVCGQVAAITPELATCRNSLNLFGVLNRSYRLLEATHAGGHVLLGLAN